MMTEFIIVCLTIGSILWFMYCLFFMPLGISDDRLAELERDYRESKNKFYAELEKKRKAKHDEHTQPE